MLSDMPPNAQSRRGLAIFAVVLIGLVAAVFAYRVGDQAETNRVQATFERVAGERITAFETGLLTTVGSVQSIASFFTAVHDPTREKFQKFTAPLLASGAGVHAFEWVQVVESADRARFEADLARQVPGFRISEPGAQGMMAARERARHYPVTMIEPHDGLEMVLGFDLASDSARRAAIEAAIATRAPQTTGRITLLQDSRDEVGFLVVFPAFDDADRLRGLALGVFRIGDVVKRFAGVGEGRADLTLSIRDLAAEPGEALLYPAKSASRAGAVATSRLLRIGGRPWLVEAVATPEFVRRETGRLPEVLLIAWLFLAGNIVWLVDRRYAVEAEVEARTAEMRQARDEAREASRAKSDFCAAMSHEIRTPLIGVVALADHLLEQDLPPPQRESVAIIARCGEHLQRVINDVLDFSKLEANKFSMESRVFDPEATARNAVALMARQAADKGLALDLRIDGELPPQVEGDAARLRQILLNLLSNAIKFTESGGITVEVAAAPPREDGRREISFTVRDTGPGMSEEVRKKLFTEFWQADTSIARRFGGTGLGLAISRRLARQMGGDIAVDSALGQGSAFTLRAPFAPASAEAAIERTGTAERPPALPGAPADLPAPVRMVFAPPAPDSESPHDFSGRSILLAEDNPTNRAIAQTILARTGARVVEACDGAEALAAASREIFDLILMDVHMPNMTGLEATRAIRALPPPFGDTPIVALTAGAFQEDRDRCRAAGMNDFLAKPYRGGPLREMAARAIGMVQTAAPPPGEASGSELEAPAFAFESFALLGAEVGGADARVLLSDFMTDASARLEILEAELRKGELREPGRQAHALKSSAASLGLARLAAIARELEAAAGREDAPHVETLGLAARAALDEARSHVAKILAA